MEEGEMGIFEENRFRSAEGVVRHSIISGGEIVGDKILEMSPTNQFVDAISLDRDTRVFTVGDLTIDLRDVGPRKRINNQ
jgi:hypothetical protein